MPPQYATDDRKTRSARSQPLVDWMDGQFDALRREHSGPEALAWDGQGLQVAAGPAQGDLDPV